MPRAKQLPASKDAPSKPNLVFQEGIRLQNEQKFEEALKVFLKLAQHHPNESSIYNRLGQVTFALGKFADAAQHFTNSLKHKPKQSDIWASLGVVYRRLKTYDQARYCQEQAIAHNPGNAVAYNNLGILLHEAFHLHDDAVQSYDQALSLDPNLADAYYNKGNLYKDQNNFKVAIECYLNAIKLNPRFGNACLNLAICYGVQKNYPASLKYYKQAIHLGVNSRYVYGQYTYTRLQVCDWPGLEEDLAKVTDEINAGNPVIAPFQTHTLFNDPALLQRAAETFAKIEYPVPPDVTPAQTHPAHQRIRVAYVSSDYWNHPVSHLILGLFQAHDRNRFEVIALSVGNPAKDEWHERIKQNCDRFIDVSALSDREIAETARRLEVDIAIDLNGYTEYRRTGAFAHRLAPVQMSYIGFLGTMGTPFMDYLVADSIIIPDHYRRFYHEKIISLPSFQSNSPLPFNVVADVNRAMYGLPEPSFVYCSFNNNYKITPQVFASWMRILSRVPHSVLWLYVNNPDAQKNLHQAAESHGVAASRIIFCDKAPYAEHLARQPLANLFLDSLPYNAGATASNALRVGLPVLTRVGHAFAARMGASLLTTVGLPELITTTHEAYEDLAVRLGKDPVLMASIRKKLQTNLATTALFNHEAFARSIETAYIAAHQRACAGEPPVHLRVQGAPAPT